MRFLPLLLSAALACGGTSAAPAPPKPDAEILSGDAVVMLYRSPCASGCPVYSVRATGDGLVTYDGRARVARLGVRTLRIPESKVDGLLHELEGAGYFGFADRYRPGELACGRYVPDAPTAITAVRNGDMAKRIEHDGGCGGAPQSLTLLERRIDEVLGTERWTGR
jgi:Domain of unknown function (DUF6438)